MAASTRLGPAGPEGGRFVVSGSNAHLYSIVPGGKASQTVRFVTLRHGHGIAPGFGVSIDCVWRIDPVGSVGQNRVTQGETGNLGEPHGAQRVSA